MTQFASVLTTHNKATDFDRTGASSFPSFLHLSLPSFVHLVSPSSCLSVIVPIKMVKASRRSTHKTPHKSSTKPSPDTGWSSSFDHVSPYANGANDSDTEFEPYDVYYGLDISKRHDQAQFTKTPFTITQSQASSRSKSSKAAREAQELATGTASRNPSSSSSGKTMVEPKKTLEERIAEQEAADRKGGRSMTPSIEPPKAKKEDKGNSWSYKSNSGWKNAHGQPVAATKPPNPSKVINALNKIDKKASKAAKKRKAPDPAPASATVSAKTTAPAPPPALKAPPKSIREQLDDIERETKIKTKTTLSSAERKKVPAQDVHRPIAGRGKGREKKTVINKDDDISFKMLRESVPSTHVHRGVCADGVQRLARLQMTISQSSRA